MAKLPFRYLPHMADVSFIAYGTSYKEVFENASQAILNTMFDLKKIKSTKAKVKTLRINVSATDKAELSWFALQDIVSRIDEKGVMAFKFKVNSIKEQNGKIKMRGCIFYKATKEYMALLDVKAVTPSTFEVKNRKGKWSIKAILDV